MTLSRILAGLGRRFAHRLSATPNGVDAPLTDVERRFSRLDRKLDGLARRAADDRLLLKRLEALLSDSTVARGRRRRAPPAATERIAPLRPSEVADWRLLDACAVCGHKEATVVCEYNRFLLHPHPPDPDSAIYNYSLCHGCGVVFAARRPTGARFRALLDSFSENLGRAGAATLLLNPRPLDEAAREDLGRRASKGVFVSEHHGVRRKDWLRAALRDRMSVAVHVELLGSLLDLQKARVLEIRPRTGAIGAALQRLYACHVETLPMFEAQQYVIQAMYGLAADACVDFERFTVPAGEPFQLVVSNHMMTHSVRPAEFLATLTGRLEPGGHLYLYNEPDETEFLDAMQSMFNVLNPFHLQTFDGASLVRAAVAHGFAPVFVTHTDMNLVALFRRTPRMEERAVMSPADRMRRVHAYQRARDHAILSLPTERRQVFAAEWDEVVARAVRDGQATIDERGRLVFGRKLARTKTPEAH